MLTTLKSMETEIHTKLSEFVQTKHVLKPVQELTNRGYDHEKGCFRFLSADADGIKILYRVFPYNMSVTEEHEDHRGTEWATGELA